MAKRERGGKESLSPSSHSVASVVFVNKVSIASPPLGLWCGVDGRLSTTKSCKTGQYYIKDPEKIKPFFQRGGEKEEWRGGGGGLTPINAALYNTRKRSPPPAPTRRRNIKITFADTRISKKDETPDRREGG